MKNIKEKPGSITLPKVHTAQVDCHCDIPRCIFMKEIKLTQGKVALVDDEDYEYLSQWKWRTQNNKCTFYATRLDYSLGKYRQKAILMHRLIMGAPMGKVVDHLNHNGLDNRKCNLRITTSSINNHNRTGVKGVYKYNYHGLVGEKFRSQIMVNYKLMHLGIFDTKEDARNAYLNAKLKYCNVTQQQIDDNLSLFI